MMIGTGRDMFWSNYEKYGYTESDFEDESDVVAEAEWEEVKEQKEEFKRIEKMEDN